MKQVKREELEAKKVAWKERQSGYLREVEELRARIATLSNNPDSLLDFTPSVQQLDELVFEDIARCIEETLLQVPTKPPKLVEIVRYWEDIKHLVYDNWKLALDAGMLQEGIGQPGM